jgi:lysozyme-related protein Hpa2
MRSAAFTLNVWPQCFDHPRSFMSSIRLSFIGTVAALALATSGAAHADCVLDASRYHRVNPNILLAIAIVESGMREDAVHVNTNGSSDIGVMQINSVHLPELKRYGVKQSDLQFACKNVYTGAWLLRKRLDKYGNTWSAIGAYHSATPVLRDAYAKRVHNTVEWLFSSGNAYPESAESAKSGPIKTVAAK